MSVVTGAVNVDVGVVLKWDRSVRDTGMRPGSCRLFGKLGTPEGLKMGLGFGETTGQPMTNQ